MRDENETGNQKEGSQRSGCSNDHDPEKAECAVQFAFVAEHLERIADYATNICEETVFMLEGKELTQI